MPWFRVDDGFPAHPRLESLEGDPRLYMAALTVWLLMGCDCANRLTDGRCSVSRVRKVCIAIKSDAIRGAEALVRIGLWEREGSDYRFRNWSKYQPSRDTVKRKIAQKTERQRRWRDRRADAFVDASTPASVDPPVDGAPSHPIPSRSEERERERGLGSCGEPRACTHTHAHEAQPWQPAPEPPLAPLASIQPQRLDGWTADRMALTFRSTYLQRKEIEPSMAGKLVGDLHRRVCETARVRGVAPHVLFADVLERWLARPHSKVERSAPYACFAQAFGELVDGDGEQRVKSASASEFEREVAECLRVVTGGRGGH